MPLTFSELATADRPLDNPASDSLGRTAFANRIAQELRDLKGREHLVISLDGEAGSGKTTLKNFVRHLLATPDAPDRPVPVVVEFNPWEWSGDERMLRGFFDQVAEQLGAHANDFRLHTLAESWKAIGTILAAGAEADNGAAMLREARNAVRTHLEALASRLVIFIDDIDRLQPPQIRALLRLVKVNAGFPNLVCFLVFQKSTVIDALEGATAGSASEYLRRIIDVEFDLPDVPESLLRRQLETSLEEILATVTFPMRPRERWNDVFSGAVWPLFSTPRDVKRFLSAFAFQFAGFFRAKERVLEVNPIDLVLVETLRMFAPTVYSELRDTFRRREIRLVRLISGREEERKEARLEVDRSVEQLAVTGRKKRALTTALQQLVPLGTGGSHGGREDWDRDLRLCSPRHVEHYFHLGAVTDAVPAHRLIEMARATDDREKLEALLLQAAEEGMLPETLERLPALIQGIPEAQAIVAAVALCGICDQIPAQAPEDLEARLIRLACELFANLTNPLKRENVVAALLDDPARLTGPILLLQSLRPRSDGTSGVGAQSLSIEQFRRLIKPAAEKLQESALSGAIWNSREAGTLIKRWWEWSGEKSEVQNWLLAQVKEPNHARAWLRTFLSPSATAPGKEMVLQLEELVQYCDPRPIAASAPQANGDSLDRAVAIKLGQALATKGTSGGFSLRTIAVPLEVDTSTPFVVAAESARGRG